jgi:hypothetical protein
MRARHWFALVAVVALAYACGSRTHVFPMATAAAADTRVSSGIAAGEYIDTGHGSAPLTSTTQVNVLNDGVNFVVTVTNNSAKKIELTFPDGQTHDVSVHDAAGSEIWRWSTGQMFTQSLRNHSLAPHATLSYSMHWRRPQVHGPLIATGSLTSANFPITSSVTFVLP